ncbi:MAG TPA: NADP-dependent oxidoreductase [Opitutaceae bacterium]|jgi:NADPH:quinone reductase-like Zn-dependent oxidoreductase
MRAERIHQTGGPAAFKNDKVPLPKPGRGEYLIEVHYAGVNPVDIKIRKGEFAPYRPKLPAVLGRDISGVVRECGPRGTKGGFKVGTSVFGMLDYDRGAYAEFTLASDREIVAVPKRLKEKEAGALGVAALTAWQGLFDHGRLKKGQRVLIHGAAGGVGHFAVQFAKVRGATVVATASERDLGWVKDLGADQVIDFKNERFEEHTGQIDLVFDLVGGETQKRSWSVLKRRGGTLVSTLAEPSSVEAARRKARAFRMVVKGNSKQLKTIASLVARGRVRVAIDKVFLLQKVGQAHRYLGAAHPRGKVVLDATPGWADLGRVAATEEPAELAMVANEVLARFPPFY